MPLSSAQLNHLAELAGLVVPPERRARLQDELDRIVAYVDELEIDSSGSGLSVGLGDGAATAIGGGVTACPLRPDRPGATLPVQRALAAAAQPVDGYFSAPPISAAAVRSPAAPTGLPLAPSVSSAPAAPARAAEPPPRADIDDLNRLTMSEAGELRDSGDLTDADLTAIVGRACARHASSLAAFTELADPAAQSPPVTSMSEAARSPLRGFGAALKANICARGLRADCGSRLLADYRPAYDATVVRRLHGAGVHLLGTTTMDEFGMGSSTEYAAGGPACNPWCLSRSPGGSSGGAAAAVAAGMAWFALGSDTGGSVRLPAHCCGVVGFKPTYGRISRYGLVAYASSLDQIGVLARSVADAALVYGVLAGRDGCDATSATEPVGDPVAAVGRPPRRLRLGVPRTLLAGDLAPAIAADLTALVRELAGDGIGVVDVDLPHLPRALAAYYVLACAEAASNLARFDGVVYGERISAPNWQTSVAATRTAGFGLEVQRRILLGTFVLSAGYHDAYYRRALATRAVLAAELRDCFARCDVLLMPTAATTAFKLGERTRDPLAMYRTDLYTVPASLAGLPAISVPTGIAADGLPLSAQLIGSPFGEQTLLAAAGAVQRLRPFRNRQEAPWLR